MPSRTSVTSENITDPPVRTSRSAVKPTAGLAVGKSGADRVENIIVASDLLATYQRAGLFQGLADSFSARNFPDPNVPGIVFEDDDIAGEEWAMRPAEIEQHAVMAGPGMTCSPVMTGVPFAEFCKASSCPRENELAQRKYDGLFGNC